MSKTVKIAAIAVIVLIIVGAVYIKYIKPKMDERKELKRLKEADLITTAAKTTTPGAGYETVEAIIAETQPKLIGIGGQVIN